MSGIDGATIVRGGNGHASLSSTDYTPQPSFNMLFSCENEDEEPRPITAGETSLLSPDARYEDKPREKHNERSLEEVMRMRGATA